MTPKITQKPLTIAELEKRIIYHKQALEIWTAKKERPPDREQLAKKAAGDHYFDIGTCCLLLGSLEKALKNFANSVVLYEEGAPISTPSSPSPSFGIFNKAQESALLSGDLAKAENIANIVVRQLAEETGETLSNDRMAYIRALPCLIANVDERAHPYIEAAMNVSPKKAWYPGLGMMLYAIVQGSISEFQSGLESVLKKHNARAKARKSWAYNMPEAFICIPATALSIIAARRGIISPQDVSGRHATLKLALRYLEEFEGRPIEKGETSDLHVDYIPKLLLQ